MQDMKIDFMQTATCNCNHYIINLFGQNYTVNRESFVRLNFHGFNLMKILH